MVTAALVVGLSRPAHRARRAVTIFTSARAAKCGTLKRATTRAMIAEAHVAEVMVTAGAPAAWFDVVTPVATVVDDALSAVRALLRLGKKCPRGRLLARQYAAPQTIVQREHTGRNPKVEQHEPWIHRCTSDHQPLDVRPR